MSFASLLQGGQTPVHDSFVLERLVDPTDPPSYCGVRTTRYKYVRYATGEEELYDLSVDPWELRSRHAAAGARHDQGRAEGDGESAVFTHAPRLPLVAR